MQKVEEYTDEQSENHLALYEHAARYMTTVRIEFTSFDEECIFHLIIVFDEEDETRWETNDEDLLMVPVYKEDVDVTIDQLREFAHTWYEYVDHAEHPPEFELVFPELNLELSIAS